MCENSQSKLVCALKMIRGVCESRHTILSFKRERGNCCKLDVNDVFLCTIGAISHHIQASYLCRQVQEIVVACIDSQSDI